MKLVLSVVAAVVMDVLAAADLPFYKTGCDATATNRAAASVVVSANAAALDSRTAMAASSSTIAFRSDEAVGLMFIVR